VYILVSFLQVTFIPIPGMVTILAGTLLFEPWEAFLYSLIGMFLGGSLGFYLGRVLGKKFVYWIAGDKQKVDEYLDKIKGRETVLLFFMFLFPFFPDDLLCSVAGISKIKFKTFSIIQMITRITSIGCTILVYGGYFIPLGENWGWIVIGILSVLGIIAFIFSYKYADQIQEWFVNIYNKVGNWFKNLFKKKENK
jgi:uncharacterized membrane protein YdjX (TVP38/TMEM64 family)